MSPEDDGSGSLLGKYASDLQEDVVITKNGIGGTLKYVDDYTGFSGNPELQSGHYLALKFEAPEECTVTVQLIGAQVNPNPVELDSDMNIVLRITDPSTQKIKVVYSMEGYDDTSRTFDLTSIVLAEEEEETSGEGE